MKHFIKISIVLLLSWILSPEVIYSDFKEIGKKEKTENSKINTKFVSKYQFEIGYEETIKFIKRTEGFAGGAIYADVCGINTIGYGHVVLPTDTFTGPISRQIADRLVRQDFDKAIRAVENETHLTGYKKIAMAHFVFTRGIGNFTKSELKKKILSNQDIREELTRWSFYRSVKGELIKSEHAYNIRLWEFEMYTRE
jgi:GH24 family phage-related lysozyme (muramidase)